jgi:glycosyltransferase involved in cell wall biosynthesis
MVKQLPISIIFWEGYLEVSPTVVSITSFFAEKKFDVDLFLRDNGEFNNESSIMTLEKLGVNVIRIPTSTKLKRISVPVIYKRAAGLLHRIGLVSEKKYQNAKNLLQSHLNINEYKEFGRIVHKRSSRKYLCCFAIDSTGLMAYKFSHIHTRKLINVSLEIWEELSKYKSRDDKLIKKNELLYIRKHVHYITIQDQYRWAAYKRINNIKNDNKVLYLPNSCRRNDEQIKEDYFREIFYIDKTTYIVLSAGMICDEVHSLDIANAIGKYNFKHDVKVVFHERLLRQKNDPYLQTIERVSKGKIILSLNPVEYDRLPNIISGADIGLVIYNQEINDNFKIIGATSGKMFRYLSCGIPIISSSNPGLKDIVNQYKIGIVVDSINEIPKAIDDIIDNYHYYSSNAIKTYNDFFDMNIFLDKLVVCALS